MAMPNIPVSEGDTLELSVESQGGRGDGIAKVEGFVVFISGAKVGEKCRVKITKVARTYAMAQKL